MQSEAEQCKACCINPEKIFSVEHQIIPEAETQILAEFFRIFGDVTRLKILQAVAKEELCVCDLCELLGLNQSQVSHQLQLLRNSKLVKFRREGKQIFYSLDDEHVELIIQMALDHILEEEEKHGML